MRGEGTGSMSFAETKHLTDAAWRSRIAEPVPPSEAISFRYSGVHVRLVEKVFRTTVEESPATGHPPMPVFRVPGMARWERINGYTDQADFGVGVRVTSVGHPRLSPLPHRSLSLPYRRPSCSPLWLHPCAFDLSFHVRLYTSHTITESASCVNLFFEQAPGEQGMKMSPVLPGFSVSSGSCHGNGDTFLRKSASPVTDPRQRAKEPCPFGEILLPIPCRVVSGCEGFVDIALYGAE